MNKSNTTGNWLKEIRKAEKNMLGINYKERPFYDEAQIVRAAMESLSKNPENLENFICYLECHFASWLEKFANTPQNFASELKEFASIDFGLLASDD